MDKAYSRDLRERVIKKYELGMTRKILSFHNRWIRKYKDNGSVEPCIRTKYRTRKFSDEALREHVLKNPSATLEERAIFFQSSISLFIQD